MKSNEKTAPMSQPKPKTSKPKAPKPKALKPKGKGVKKKKRATHSKSAAFPSKQQVIDFITASEHPVGKREIAKQFSIKGPQRIRLKKMIRELKEEGLIAKGKKMGTSAQLPPVSMVVITGQDEDGELMARPQKWERKDRPPPIYMMPGKPDRPDFDVGDHVLCRLTKSPEDAYIAKPIHKVEAKKFQLIGTLTKAATDKHDGIVQPTDRKQKHTYHISLEESLGAAHGDLVKIETRPNSRQARVIERIGKATAPKALSLISIETHGLPLDFPDKVVTESEKAKPIELGTREDLRHVPLVTIDGEDSRDFDDAVFAEKDGSGWHLIVSIADVAHYVRPGSALDEEALKRGNSAYFPDRVVPMLPEKLSNDLCSLRPDVDRACLAVHLYIDDKGNLTKQKFVRGLMRSHARLTYTQVQLAKDGQPDELTAPLMDKVITPLYRAYDLLNQARQARGTLDLDLPENYVVLNKAGHVEDVVQRERLDSHRLIEEFMITANVAAARALEAKRAPCMYRIHELPPEEKVNDLRQALAVFGYKLAKGQVIRPAVFASILERAEGRGEDRTINNLILRSQSKAVYSPENIGHFGLALTKYAHFTSPIRRYSDLLVHRSLIKSYGLGDGGLSDQEVIDFADIGEHISETERRAQKAEYDARDRYMAAFLSDKIGHVFKAHINGVNRFGMFVTLDTHGADGFVPVRLLTNDYYHFDEKSHSLKGRRSNTQYKVGDVVKVKLKEANPLMGSTVFEIVRH